MPTPTPVVALIVRKSTKDEVSRKTEDHSVSVQTQEKLGRRWAATSFPGVEVRVYTDDGVSGTDMARSGWRRFLDDLHDPTVRIVQPWAYSQSRVTRRGVNTWDEVCDELTNAGIGQLVTERQGTISVKVGNRLAGRITAVIDEDMREQARMAVLDTMRELAHEGRPHGGRMYGYRKGVDEHERKTRIVDEAEAAVIREIADRLLKGESLTGIAYELTARGVPTALCAPQWTTQHVRSVVLKPSVAGLRPHRGEIVAEARWPAILDRGTWEEVRTLLTSKVVLTGRDGRQRSVPRTRRTSRRYLLTGGTAVCGVCGADLTAQRRTGRPEGDGRRERTAIYMCHPSRGGKGCTAVVAEPFEDFVVKSLHAALDLPALAALLTSTDDEHMRETRVALRRAESKLADLSRRWADDEITEAEWEAARPVLVEQATRLRSRIESLAGPALALPSANGIAKNWPDLPFAQRQEVVRVVIRRIVVSRARPGARRFEPERVTIEWRA